MATAAVYLVDTDVNSEAPKGNRANPGVKTCTTYSLPDSRASGQHVRAPFSSSHATLKCFHTASTQRRRPRLTGFWKPTAIATGSSESRVDVVRSGALNNARGARSVYPAN